ncbi:MAG TPA: hypothetical protein VF317_13160 [Dermatophilaceae bacterium]
MTNRFDPADQTRAESAWGEYWAATRAVELTGVRLKRVRLVWSDVMRLAG